MSGAEIAQTIDDVEYVRRELDTLWVAHMGNPVVVIQVGRMQAEADLASQLLRSIDHGFKLVARSIERAS